MRNATAGKM